MRRIGFLVALALAWGCSTANDGGDAALDRDPPRQGPQDPGGQQGDKVTTPAEVRIYMEPAVLDELYERDPYADDRLPARVQLPGMDEPIEADGVEFRGSNSRTYPKKSFDLELEEPEELVFGGDELPGSDKMNLNAMWTDPTGMRERLAFRLYESVGIASPGTFYSDVYLNDIFEGLYVTVERVDQDLLARWELPAEDGAFTLVRDEMNEYPANSRRTTFGAPLEELGASEAERIEALREIFNSRGEDELQDWAGLLELLRFTAETEPGSDFAHGFAERFDLENVLDFLALHALLQDSDSLDGDYWLYRESEGGKWRLIPWDKNLTFGKSFFEEAGGGANDYLAYDLGLFSTQENALFEKFLATPELRDALHDRIRERMEEFDAAWIRRESEAALSQIRSSLEREPGAQAYDRHPQQHFGALGMTDQNVEALHSFVERRRLYLERLLDPPAAPEPYRASVQLEEAEAGDRIFLVDGFGWVIADVELEAAVQQATLSAEVLERDAAEGGVDRAWRLAVDGDAIEGRLTLYYRNLPPPFENWAPEPDALAGQERLVVARLGEAGAVERLASDANPYADLVGAQVVLEGEQLLALVPAEAAP